MIALFALMLICLFARCSFGSNPEYMSRRATASVNGIFILFVFFRHIKTYVTKLNRWYDQPFIWINGHIKQFLVATFLFYSGYGIYCSIAKKPGYIRNFPRNRIFKLWRMFAIAVSLYLLLRLALGRTIELENVLLSFIGWKSLGNSNWYIFCVLCLYVFTWLSFTLADIPQASEPSPSKHIWVPIAFTTLMTILYIFQMSILKGSSQRWWYNTVLCYPAGMWYALCKERIDALLMYNHKRWTLVLITLLAAFLTFYNFTSNIWYYEICSIAFALIVVCLTMRFSFDSKAYQWLGNHLFPLYILQRIPMIVFKATGLAASHKHLYIGLCFVLMILLAMAYEFVEKKLHGLLAKRS